MRYPREYKCDKTNITKFEKGDWKNPESENILWYVSHKLIINTSSMTSSDFIWLHLTMKGTYVVKMISKSRAIGIPKIINHRFRIS